MGKSWKDKRDKWERTDKKKRSLNNTKPLKGGKKNQDKKFNTYEEDETFGTSYGNY